MEKIRGIVNRGKKALKFEDENLFDKDFGFVMKGFFYTGLYRTESSRINFWISFAAPLAMVLGSIKDFFSWIFEGDIVEILINGVLLLFFCTYTFQLWTFWKKQNLIVELVKDIQKLHPREFDLRIEKRYRAPTVKLMKRIFLFELFEICLGVALMCFGVTFSKLMYPLIFDVLAQGKLLYGFCAFLNILHFAFSTMSFSACELLHVLCIARLEGNLKILGDIMKTCADESDLISCVQYQLKILE